MPSLTYIYIKHKTNIKINNKTIKYIEYIKRLKEFSSTLTLHETLYDRKLNAKEIFQLFFILSEYFRSNPAKDKFYDLMNDILARFPPHYNIQFRENREELKIQHINNYGGTDYINIVEGNFRLLNSYFSSEQIWDMFLSHPEPENLHLGIEDADKNILRDKMHYIYFASDLYHVKFYLSIFSDSYFNQLDDLSMEQFEIIASTVYFNNNFFSDEKVNSHLKIFFKNIPAGSPAFDARFEHLCHLGFLAEQPSINYRLGGSVINFSNEYVIKNFCKENHNELPFIIESNKKIEEVMVKKQNKLAAQNSRLFAKIVKEQPEAQPSMAAKKLEAQASRLFSRAEMKKSSPRHSPTLKPSSAKKSYR